MGLIQTIGPVQAAKFTLSTLLNRPTATIRIYGVEITLRTRSTDYVVAKTSLGGEFTPVKDFVDHNFDGLIIDAGGYIGTAALALSKLFPKATIVSIEAASRNFSLLERNAAQHANIHPIHAALSTEAGQTVTLKDRQTGNWGMTIVSSKSLNAAAEDVETVPTITVAEIAERFPDKPIGLMKLDIEGAEKALFEQAGSDLHMVPVIFAELHERIIAGCEAAFHDFSKDRKVERFGGEKFISVARS